MGTAQVCTAQSDLQHALDLEGDRGGEAKVQLPIQAVLTGDAAAADHAAPAGSAASHLQNGTGWRVQTSAAAAGWRWSCTQGRVPTS